MDDEVRARLDAMEQRIDGAMWAMSTVLWAITEQADNRMKIMGRLSHFLSDQFLQEDTPALVASVKLIRDHILEIEMQDQKMSSSN